MMRKCIFALCLVLSYVGNVSAQVTFRFSDGIDNQSLKAGVERSVSALLSEINNAEAAGREINLSAIPMEANAREGLTSLWRNIRFRCEWTNNVQSCLQDMTGYEIRQIPVEMKPLGNTYRGELHKELTVSFSRQGTITGVRMAMDKNSYMALMRGGNSNVEMRMRNEILKFVEDFRSYYVEKNIDALKNIFSDDALIITGRVIRRVEANNVDGISKRVREKVVYSKQSKKQYMDNLQALFKSTRYVHVDFSDIDIIRHGSNPKIYGVRLRQKWHSQRYNGNQYADDGTVFLLWDFTDEDNPQIYVRTWTPLQAGGDGDDFTPEQFYLPNRSLK